MWFFTHNSFISMYFFYTVNLFSHVILKKCDSFIFIYTGDFFHTILLFPNLFFICMQFNFLEHKIHLFWYYIWLFFSVNKNKKCIYMIKKTHDSFIYFHIWFWQFIFASNFFKDMIHLGLFIFLHNTSIFTCNF